MDYNAFVFVVGLWGLVLFGFAIAEMVSLRGNCFHFSLGAIAALTCYYTGHDVPVQIGAFVLVSAISFLVLRPLFRKIANKNSVRHEEGLDELVGLEGKVIAKIDVDADTGRVEVEGRPVKAIPEDPRQKYNVGDHVLVTDYDGDLLIVKKLPKKQQKKRH